MTRWNQREQDFNAVDRDEDARRNKYLIGRVTAGSSGYNIINAGYEQSSQGQ